MNRGYPQCKWHDERVEASNRHSEQCPGYARCGGCLDDLRSLNERGARYGRHWPGLLAYNQGAMPHEGRIEDCPRRACQRIVARARRSG